MKIAYFINTFKSINWGGQATSSGIKHMLNKAYPNAEFIPMQMPDLPFKKIKFLRRYYEYKIVKAIRKDSYKDLVKALENMNISSSIFEGYSHICFNGEGAVHDKSGHIRVFMALLYLAKLQGKKVVAINQTVDLNRNKILEELLAKVYNQLDFISVREPLSFEYLKQIGVKRVNLIPDAVYGLPKMDQKQIKMRIEPYGLPETYITFTGSSSLKRNKHSQEQVREKLQSIRKYFKFPIVFMANAKTDIWLAHKLKDEFNLKIIEPPVKYEDAMAIIANSKILIGGRQHPNIFAFIYKIPYLPFSGNTFKNEGVALLQKYPIKPLSWDTSKSDFLEYIKK